MKFFVAYPILFDCNLRCSYCFHHERFYSNYIKHPGFSINDYIRFRNTHFKNAEEILVHFHGGEPFINTNINSICTIIRSLEIEKFDLLTNGLQLRENYEKILPYKDRISRIGFTFHRKMIAHIPSLVEKYEENVLFLHDHGFPVYVKELLFHEYYDQIREYKRKWNDLNIPFSVQDFKGFDRGKDHKEFKNYDVLDLLLIDSEYKKGGHFCTCKKGYKTVLIGGHTIGGKVFGCFEDMVIVGDIKKNEFNPNYRVRINKSPDAAGSCVEVEGVPKVYYFDKVFREKGIYKPKGCGND
jgi:uncharacterized Fe-S cluster-containing radical SAM superfamily protein